MDVISVSSGSEDSSEQDSDIEFVGCYTDHKDDAAPFIRAELFAVTPFLIDITGHRFPPVKHRHTKRPRKRPSATTEVIDLNNDSFSIHFPSSDSQLHKMTPNDPLREAENWCVASPVSSVTKSNGQMKNLPYTENQKDVICLDSHDGDGSPSPLSVSPVQEIFDQHNAALPHFKEQCQNSCASDQLDSETQVPEQSDTFQTLHSEDWPLSSKSPTEMLEHSTVTEHTQNTKHTHQKSSSPDDCSFKLDREHNKEVEFPPNWLDREPSPFSLDSPYYCRSEIDGIIFSDESIMEDFKNQDTACGFSDHLSGIHRAESPASTVVEMVDLHKKEHTHPLPDSQAHSQLTPRTLQTSGGVSPVNSLPCGQNHSASPTSTEILAGDSPDTVTSFPDLAIESPPSSPLEACSCSHSSPPAHLPFPSQTALLDSNTTSLSSSEYPPPSQWIRCGMDEEDTKAIVGSDVSESSAETRQYVSLVQFKKLKHMIGGGFQDVPVEDEEGEDYGPTEPLCRQSLSLVFSTMEENYPEGTVQLLADLIQPCYYPPDDIMAHLLRGILLEPQCTDVLRLEAYNLLMRAQKYHPADILTVPWDWELLSSVMAEQNPTKRLCREVLCLLMHYVLRVLEDDFKFKLPLQRLHLSVVKAMLSCDGKFTNVRDVISWLLDVAKESFCHSEGEEMQKREQNYCHKMLLFFQRMLLLSMEVDRTPTCSSNKLSQELWSTLNSTAPCRRLRLLLLNTLESSLLKCKLLELLLDEACIQKRPLPMSNRLLLHFLKTSTLAPDPLDGTERWRRWDELLKLVWMLMLSYEEVMRGHLRYSITERVTLTRPPIWTQNDQVNQAEVQEAAEVFLCRVLEDLGHAIPSHIQESLSQLQEHLLSISLH